MFPVDSYPSKTPSFPDVPFLTAMCQHSGLSMIVVDLDARITLVVGRIRHDVEFSGQGAIGQSIDDFFKSDPKHAQLYHQALRNQESKVVFKSLSGGFYEVRIFPLFDAAGQINGALGFGFDVTERENALRAVQTLSAGQPLAVSAEDEEAEARTRTMLDATPLASSFWDRTGRMLDCNMEALRLFGLSKKSDYIEHFFDLNPEFQPDGELTAAKADRLIAAAFETGFQRFEWVYKTLDGQPLPVETTLVRVPWKGDYCLAAYSRDLRDIKANERKIREANERNRELEIRQLAVEEANERTRLMLDATPLCCNLWNERLETTDCNLEAIKLFGFTSKKEYLDHFFKLSPTVQPDGRSTVSVVREKIAGAFQTGFERFEWTHQMLNGTPVPAEVTLVRVQHGDSPIVLSYIRDLRESKKMLAEIEEVNERMRIMLDATPLCCNFWDENFQNIDCNLEAPKLFDLKDKQEYLDRFMELSPEFQPDGRPTGEKALEKVEAAFETGYQRFEWMHQKLDGTPIPAEITLVRVQRNDKYIVVGYPRDLRDFKKMLAEMREADERTQIMLDATPLCCNLWDEHFNNIDCNLEAVKLFNLKDKQQYLDRFFELSPPVQPNGRPTSEMALENITTAFRDGYCRFEWMHQRLDGTPIPSEITLVRVKQGDRFIVAGYTRDMRELKKNEVALELDRQRTNALLELAEMTNRSEQEIVDFTIATGVRLTGSTIGYSVMIDPSKNVLPFRSLVFGEQEDCSISLHSADGTPHTLSRPLIECLEKRATVIHDDFAALPGERTFPKGHFPVHSHMNMPIFDGDQPVGILGVGNKETSYTETDVKQLTLLAQGMGSQLGRRRYAETLEKAKVEAENARIDAENANKAKSEFLAHMSHEIRTPLNGVIGLSDLLLGTEMSAKQHEYAQLINASGKSLLFLINDILDFSKIEAGKLEIDSEPFDLCATVESVLGILISRAGAKNLELAVAFCRNLPRIVRGDSGRIRQILLNLVGNAVKFTDRGGARIDVDIESVRDDGVTVRFRVIDTGIGIPQNRIDRLFKAFSQADASSARIYGGTGLGLAISMKLVQLMGGKIGVESEEGKGSTFWFTVPFDCDSHVIQCLRDDLSDCPRALDKSCPNIDGNYCMAFANKGIGGEYSLRGRSVLVVDDNVIQRETICDQLEHWEMTCENRESGKEVLDWLKQAQQKKKSLELLIIDNSLTDGEGIELARQIVEWEEHEKIRGPQMILLRPLAEELDPEFLERNGIESLSKPVFASALFDAVMNRIFAFEKRKNIDSGIIDPNAPSDIKIERAKTRPQRSVVAPSEKIQSSLRGKIHLLVVEDNRVNQIVARNLLEEAGFSCDVVNNGNEACQTVRAKHFDVILMDCQMPEMDGYEATDLIRKWEREQGKRRIPIIALTANATKEDVQKCLDAGMDAYCSKPISPQIVLRMVEEWYEKSLTQSEPRP